MFSWSCIGNMKCNVMKLFILAMVNYSWVPFNSVLVDIFRPVLQGQHFFVYLDLTLGLATQPII